MPRNRKRISRRARVDMHEPQLAFLFVVTYGRSGSTLLQGVLNDIPGYLIRGENRQAMRHLWAYHRTSVEERNRQRRRRKRKGLGSQAATHAYFGIDEFPVRRSVRGIRRLALETLLRPEPDTRVVGFKEIRWYDDDVVDYVDWLRLVFPGARFLINTRDLDDVSKSGWWADEPGARERLGEIEARMLSLGEALGPAAFHVRYDDYVADPAQLRPLFEWLGEDDDERRVRAVLDTRHSY